MAESEVVISEVTDLVRDVNTPGGNIREVDSTSGNKVSMTLQAAALTSNTDFTVTFSLQVNHVWVQNNSSTLLNIEIDDVANAGTLNIAANTFADFDCPCSVLHLYSAATTTVNGTGAANIVVRGWL